MACRSSSPRASTFGIGAAGRDWCVMGRRYGAGAIVTLDSPACAGTLRAVGRESLEPHELAEPEDFARAARSRLSSRIAVTVAVLAVLASISSREAERYASESILDKNEAILAQARSSDDWAYRQAKA